MAVKQTKKSNNKIPKKKGKKEILYCTEGYISEIIIKDANFTTRLNPSEEFVHGADGLDGKVPRRLILANKEETEAKLVKLDQDYKIEIRDFRLDTLYALKRDHAKIRVFVNKDRLNYKIKEIEII